MTLRRVGLLGGTFDPIHTGHIELARGAERALDLSCVFLIPSFVPPHRPQTAASSHHRFAMASLAVIGHQSWYASDIELQSHEPSYTSTTLQRFQALGYSESQLFFIIGADAFAEIETWRNYPAILDLAHFAVVSRPGFAVHALEERLAPLARRMTTADAVRASPAIILIDAPTPDVSATTIRQRVKTGESIAGLVPALVQQHIEQHGLYSVRPPGRCASKTTNVPAAGRLHGED
jgi:nicotinate-nucleotide adenylyltransferase